MTPARPAVFVDRDGTLNRAFVRGGVSHPPEDETQLQLLPGASEALRVLKSAGLLVIVVTNQPDVARGTQSPERVNRINSALHRMLPNIDAIECCFHDDPDGCACRKPSPGMLVAAAARFSVDLNASFMIGDSWRDTLAGQRAGCTAIQVGREQAPPRVSPDFVASDVCEAAKIVMRVLQERSMPVDPIWQGNLQSGRLQEDRLR